MSFPQRLMEINISRDFVGTCSMCHVSIINHIPTIPNYYLSSLLIPRLCLIIIYLHHLLTT